MPLAPAASGETEGEKAEWTRRDEKSIRQAAGSQSVQTDPTLAAHKRTLPTALQPQVLAHSLHMPVQLAEARDPQCSWRTFAATDNRAARGDAPDRGKSSRQRAATRPAALTLAHALMLHCSHTHLFASPQPSPVSARCRRPAPFASPIPRRCPPSRLHVLRQSEQTWRIVPVHRATRIIACTCRAGGARAAATAVPPARGVARHSAIAAAAWDAPVVAQGAHRGMDQERRTPNGGRPWRISR